MAPSMEVSSFCFSGWVSEKGIPTGNIATNNDIPATKVAEAVSVMIGFILIRCSSLF
jgi:hypothetical protein